MKSKHKGRNPSSSRKVLLKPLHAHCVFVCAHSSVRTCPPSAKTHQWQCLVFWFILRINMSQSNSSNPNPCSQSHCKNAINGEKRFIKMNEIKLSLRTKYGEVEGSLKALRGFCYLRDSFHANLISKCISNRASVKSCYLMTCSLTAENKRAVLPFPFV